MFPPADAGGQQGHHHQSPQHNGQQQLVQGTTPKAKWSHHHTPYRHQRHFFGQPRFSRSTHRSPDNHQQQHFGQGISPVLSQSFTQHNPRQVLNNEGSNHSIFSDSSSSGMTPLPPRTFKRKTAPHKHTDDMTAFTPQTFKHLKTPYRHTTAVPLDQGSDKSFTVYGSYGSKGGRHLVRSHVRWDMSVEKLEQIKRDRQQQLSQGGGLPGSISTMTPAVGYETDMMDVESRERDIEIMNTLGMTRSEFEAEEVKHGFAFWAGLNLYGTNLGNDDESDFMSVAQPELSI